MTKHKSVNEEADFPRRMYPNSASSSPYVKRLDSREESLLGTFIQWVDPDKNKRPVKKPGDDTKMTSQTDADTDDTVGKKFTKTFNNDRTETPNALINSNIGDITNKPTITRLMEHVHLSRPATPQPPTKTSNGSDTASEPDKYRIMYLLVRVQQQQEHLRNVVDNMARLNRSVSERQNMVNVLGGVSNMYRMLIGLRDNDPKVIKQIGGRKDIEEFLQKVESMCSQVEEIAVPGSSDDKIARPMSRQSRDNNAWKTSNKTTGDSENKIAREKPEGRTGLEPNSFDAELEMLLSSKNAGQTANRNTGASDEMNVRQVSLVKTRQLVNKSPGTSDDTLAWQSHPKLRRRKNTPPSCLEIIKRLQSNSPRDQENKSKQKEEPAIKQKTQEGPIKDQENKSKQKEEPAIKQKTQEGPIKETLAKSKSNLPGIDKQGKELNELSTLMKEIDDLMGDASIIKGKKDNMLSYEVIMLGAGENKSKQTNNKHISTTNNKQTISKQTTRKSDHFIDELDKLLDECDSV